MALKLSPVQPVEPPLPEPYYVARARDQLLAHAKSHPELVLLLDALDEIARFNGAMRRLYLQSEHGPVRAVLNGRYGLANAAADACDDISALAWDWKDMLEANTGSRRHG